jgi:hypothetical protein
LPLRTELAMTFTFNLFSDGILGAAKPLSPAS